MLCKIVTVNLKALEKVYLGNKKADQTDLPFCMLRFENFLELAPEALVINLVVELDFRRFNQCTQLTWAAVG